MKKLFKYRNYDFIEYHISGLAEGWCERQRREVKRALGSRRQNMRAMQRARLRIYPKIESLADIPLELAKTYSARHAVVDHPSYNDVYLRYADEAIVIFFSRSDLEQLHRSKHWLLDGSFKYKPKSCYQFYSIHGFVMGEVHPMANAIITNKSDGLANGYELLFRTVSEALTRVYGSIGAVRMAHFNNESAAFNAFKHYFPDVEIKLCFFHFKQAVQNQVS